MFDLVKMGYFQIVDYLIMQRSGFWTKLSISWVNPNSVISGFEPENC